jgi:galactose mutarotase-like enzyme
MSFARNAEPKEGGYDHNWALNNPGDLNALAVRVFDPKSGREVEMYTPNQAYSFTSAISWTDRSKVRMD